jgi:hypothetical protein
MKLQRQLSKKREKKKYYKYVVVLPEEKVREAGFKEGDELETETKKGEIKLKKKINR